MSVTWEIRDGDCIEVMQAMGPTSIDAVVCDPPYELGFMGNAWDQSGVAYRVETWAEVLRVLKPGGHLLAFGGARTYHRLACAIEDAGFEIRDSLAWLYGSGFPKSLDVSKAIDKAAGAEREVVGEKVSPDGVPYSARHGARSGRRAGWGTALKPGHEPIVMARRPLIGSVAANVLAHGTGALNIDACRIAGKPRTTHVEGNRTGAQDGRRAYSQMTEGHVSEGAEGRWPANLVLDEAAAELLDEQSGSASRFFYCAKASRKERGAGNTHPTVKPLKLMQWLVRLVTPPGGRVLDPFAGSGTTGVAALRESFRFVGIELEPGYAAIARERIRKDAPQLELAAASLSTEQTT